MGRGETILIERFRIWDDFNLYVHKKITSVSEGYYILN